MVESSVLPIVAALVTVLVSFQVSGFLAKRFGLNPQTRKPYAWDVSDALPLGLGFLGMGIAALLSANASVWSYFIDLGSFAVGASLVATSGVRSWPRRVGLLILGIHLAQVVLTNANAPLQGLVVKVAVVYAGVVELVVSWFSWLG